MVLINIGWNSVFLLVFWFPGYQSEDSSATELPVDSSGKACLEEYERFFIVSEVLVVPWILSFQFSFWHWCYGLFYRDTLSIETRSFRYSSDCRVYHNFPTHVSFCLPPFIALLPPEKLNERERNSQKMRRKYGLISFTWCIIVHKSCNSHP